jgi:hypothetical protein
VLFVVEDLNFCHQCPTHRYLISMIQSPFKTIKGVGPTSGVTRNPNKQLMKRRHYLSSYIDHTLYG